jgi:hypothetical protein
MMKHWRLTYKLTTRYGKSTWERFVLSTTAPTIEHQLAWERKFDADAEISDFQVSEFEPKPFPPGVYRDRMYSDWS